MPKPKKRKRARGGFATMDPEKHREIASLGGMAAHQRGLAHEWKEGDPKAKEAGRAGGKSVSKNRAHMAEIGRRGGRRKKKQKDEAAQ